MNIRLLSRSLAVAATLLGAALFGATPALASHRCGDNRQRGSELCDGTDLDGQNCTSLGFDGGILACSPSCVWDTSGCTQGGTCGDGVAEFPEDCDGADLAGADCTSVGFDGGTLGCDLVCGLDTSGCTTLPVCGDGVAELPEACDGTDLSGMLCTDLGFDGGTLACDAACGWDPSNCTASAVCGDGAVEPPEACDGANLGGQTCVSLGFDGGTLACDGACGLNTSGCTFSQVCGDGVAELPEACDGADLAGQTCAGLGFEGGALACDGLCGFDSSGCTLAASGCGDGVTSGFEECDVLDDSACPGLCSAQCACPATSSNGNLEVHVVDVGQGDGIFIVSPDGFVMAFDAGTESQGATMTAYLASIGITSIDYTVASHMHADHLGGLDGVLNAFPEVVASFDSGESATSAEFSEYAASAGARRTTLTTGAFIDLGPSMTCEVLHASQGSSNENNNSVVLKLTYGDHSYLFGGDCEASCEGQLVTGPIDVYKVHHHGSSTSTTDELLAQMGASTAIISVGLSNQFGHPTAQTIDRLAAWGLDVWRTDLDGDIDLIAGPDWFLVNGFGACTDGAQRSCGSSGVGECSLGSETCFMGTWQACTGAVEPVAEVCDNGLDDDCDGGADALDADCTTPPPPAAGTLVIAQVYYDTLGTDSVEEFVDLYNGTGVAVGLTGYSISDNAGTWTVPVGTVIDAGGYLSLARNSAGFQALFGLVPDVTGMTLSLNNTGDVLVLMDDVGAVVDEVAWEGFLPGWSITAGTGASIVRTDPLVDTDSVGDWSVQGTGFPLGGSLP